MTFEEFNRARDQALILFESQQGEPIHRVGLDAIFSACVLADRRRRGRQVAADTMPTPEWFTTTLAGMQGQRVTAGTFLMAAGRAPVTGEDVRDVCRWMRSAGHHAVKKGGQTVFQL